MEWTSEGLVIGVRRHGETSAILEVMTPDRGRHQGLVRGGRSRRMQPVLQPGNTLSLVWRARLDEHLGNFTVEPLFSRAARLMESRAGLLGLQIVAEHLRLLPERDPHPRLHDAAGVILDHIDESREAAAMIVRFEMALLEDLGFGLDLARCAVTGTRDDLVYVSPRTGRAVSRSAGAPYADRLLVLPPFMLGQAGETDAAALGDGLRLTGFFLDRHIGEPRGLGPSSARERLVSLLGRP